MSLSPLPTRSVSTLRTSHTPGAPGLRRRSRLPQALAALLVVLSGTAAAQTVRLDAARLDGNPLFPGTSSFMSGRVLVDGPPSGARLPVRLDSVRHARVDLGGTADTLVVAVGTDADGAARVFAGASLSALQPVETPAPGTNAAARGVSVATMTTGDGTAMAFEVEPDQDLGLLFFRPLDARVGQVDLDGTPRTVALVRAAGSGVYAVGPDLTVLVDADGDGVLESGIGEGAPGEARAADLPFRLSGRAFRLAAVAPDGSEATFEAVGDDAEALAVGFRMPDLALERLDGTPVRLSDLRGRIVVLNWWADFCAPCYAEMPGLTELAAEYAGNAGVAFVAVARNTRDELAAALVGRTFGYQQTAAGEAASEVMGGGFPRHVILDAEGRVLFDMLGGSPDIHRMLGAVVGPVVAAAGE